MIDISIQVSELWDEYKNEFLYIQPTTLHLEHSLHSIALWEEKWKIPYLSEKKKTREQEYDYFRCMSLEPLSDPNVVYGISPMQKKKIFEYIAENRTATTIDSQQKGRSSRFITSELVYYWMSEVGIPYECDRWHFSRLMALIGIAAEERSPKKKMTDREIYERNRALNKLNKKKFHAKG